MCVVWLIQAIRARVCVRERAGSAQRTPLSCSTMNHAVSGPIKMSSAGTAAQLFLQRSSHTALKVPLSGQPLLYSQTSDQPLSIQEHDDPSSLDMHVYRRLLVYLLYENHSYCIWGYCFKKILCKTKKKKQCLEWLGMHQHIKLMFELVYEISCSGLFSLFPVPFLLTYKEMW